MVSVGGGYVQIKEYYTKHAARQIVSLCRLIKTRNSNFKDTIIFLLEKNGADESVINFYKKKPQDKFNLAHEAFILLSTFFDQKMTAK